jgi:ankyrin repeat protein
LAPQLDRAVNTGDIKAVKKLLAKPGVKINAGLPLIKAVQRDDLKMARFLLEQGADPDWRGFVRGGSSLGDGAVMVAVSRGQLKLVRLLVTHGAKLEWTHAGQTPQSSIYKAVVSKGRRDRHGRPDWPTQKATLELLVELGADVNGVGPNVGRPVERAIALGNNKALRFLVDHKADLSVRTGQNGMPLLVSAAYFGNMEAMKLLLEQGADINIQAGREKRTALMSAVRESHVEAVRWLLEHQADVTLKDRTGRTALDYSKRAASVRIPARTKREKKKRDRQKTILELLKAKASSLPSSNPTNP